MPPWVAGGETQEVEKVMSQPIIAMSRYTRRIAEDTNRPANNLVGVKGLVKKTEVYSICRQSKPQKKGCT